MSPRIISFAAPFTISVRPLKSGSGFTNPQRRIIARGTPKTSIDHVRPWLVFALSVQGTLKIMTRFIFGFNAPHPKDKLNLNLNPPTHTPDVTLCTFILQKQPANLFTHMEFPFLL